MSTNIPVWYFGDLMELCSELRKTLCCFHLQVVLVPFLEAIGGRAISRNVWTATALASVGEDRQRLSTSSPSPLRPFFIFIFFGFLMLCLY